LVAVGVDPPLSQHDIELIRNLSRYTPNISLLLTKVDVLDEKERVQVREFVQKQLARYWNDAIPVFPYSVRPGFEHLRAELDGSLLSHVRAGAGEQRAAILQHKLDSLLSECAGYLNVALKAAEVADSEREELRRKILGRKESLDDTRLALKLIVRHAAGTTRSAFEVLLRPGEVPVRQKLQAALARQFPSWTRSLSIATEKFDAWMRAGLTSEMAELSRMHRGEFVEPVRRVGRQLSQSLQDFRNRLSDRMLERLGVPLRTTEMELRTEGPLSPDVRVGKIFDHNWELLSWLIPMALVQGAVLEHYHRKVEDLVFTNLSRLASQWEDTVNASLRALEKESIRRLDALIGTIEKLIASAGQQAPQIREDIQRLDELRRCLNSRSAPPKHGCDQRPKADRLANRACVPNSSSIRRNWLNFATRSLRHRRYGRDRVHADGKHILPDNMVQQRRFSGAHPPEHRDFEAIPFQPVNDGPQRRAELHQPMPADRSFERLDQIDIVPRLLQAP
jgi:hypothetical protein